MAYLYELTDEYSELLRRYEEAETDEEAAAIVDEMDKLQVDIKVKAENYARLMKIKDAEAGGLGKEIQRLQKKKKSAEGFRDWLKESIRVAMLQLGTPDIGTNIGCWHLQDNPMSCDVVDIALVPEEFRKPIEIPYTVDKEKAKAHFKETGEIIPGLDINVKVGIRFR